MIIDLYGRARSIAADPYADGETLFGLVLCVLCVAWTLIGAFVVFVAWIVYPVLIVCGVGK